MMSCTAQQDKCIVLLPQLSMMLVCTQVEEIQQMHPSQYVLWSAAVADHRATINTDVTGCYYLGRSSSACSGGSSSLPGIISSLLRSSSLIISSLLVPRSLGSAPLGLSGLCIKAEPVCQGPDSVGTLGLWHCTTLDNGAHCPTDLFGICASLEGTVGGKGKWDGEQQQQKQQQQQQQQA
jgi:hypothetical protein